MKAENEISKTKETMPINANFSNSCPKLLDKKHLI